MYNLLMLPTTLSKAQVVATDPDTLAIYVYLSQSAGEGPAIPVKILTSGPFDGMRMAQSSLPTRGTLGVVAALDGDARSLVWLGSLAANLQDSISTIPGQSNIECLNHYSGFYYLLDESGNYSSEFPDGTFIQIGPTVNTPGGHRVINGVRTAISLPLPSRVNNIPSPFPFSYTHPTGTKISIDSSGDVSVYGAATVNVSGATSVNIFSPNSINMKSPTVSVSGTLYVTGDILAGQGGGNNISLLNHNHPQGTDSHGDTEQNTGAPIPNT